MATNADNLLKNEVGRAFVERYQHDVIGVLHGWDRLRLQGTLRSLYYPPVMEHYLRKAGVKWKDFKQFAIGLTGRVRQAAEDKAKERRSVAEFSRRAEVSRKATDRHLTALAAVEVQSSLAQEAAQVCRAVRWEGQRYRALNPLGKTDAELLAIVNRGEFAINGFRNRDVRARLYPPTQDKRQQRREMSAMGRKLRLLRAHGLIAKVPKTHRYVVTDKGRRIITALLAARQASTEKLTALAA